MPTATEVDFQFPEYVGSAYLILDPFVDCASFAKFTHRKTLKRLKLFKTKALSATGALSRYKDSHIYF
jgi:hypothetical protein